MTTATTDVTDRFALHFDPTSYRRLIAGTEVILHCHHYNARIQRTIESASVIDGKRLFVGSAEAVFSSFLNHAIRPDDSMEVKTAVAEGLYAHLGYGRIDLSRIHLDEIVAPSSHFAEGWRVGFADRGGPACSFTEGYLQAAVHALTGEAVYVREERCALLGSAECVFRIDRRRDEPVEGYRTTPTRHHGGDVGTSVTSDNVDEEAIISAVVAVPVSGNRDGLVPAFNVYLASTPADFYNLVCYRFIEEMARHGLGDIARDELRFDAENCGMVTFQGIMSSTEWDVLVNPMIKVPRDTLFGIVAVSNALGWGNCYVREYTEGQTLTLVSRNGYEADGLRKLHGHVDAPSCCMLNGFAVGAMELVHGIGAPSERFGQYTGVEAECRSCDDDACVFDVVESP